MNVVYGATPSVVAKGNFKRVAFERVPLPSHKQLTFFSKKSCEIKYNSLQANCDLL